MVKTGEGLALLGLRKERRNYLSLDYRTTLALTKEGQKFK